jgi:hypothetical protein
VGQIPPSPPPKCLYLHDFRFRCAGFEIAGQVRRFAAMPIGHTLRRDGFKTAVVGKPARYLSWPLL